MRSLDISKLRAGQFRGSRPYRASAFADLREAHMDFKPRFVRPRDAAKLVPCGITKLYELIRSGALETKHFGGSTLISVESIERFQDSLPDGKLRPAPYAQHRKRERADAAA